ncbi:unnamed protein product, partial [Dicrocoelium dendriticum]
MSQVAASGLPVRRLFADAFSDAEDRSKTSSRCRDEAMEACRQSTERLRKFFHFDVDNMTPVTKAFTPLRLTDPTHVSKSCIPTVNIPSTRDAGFPRWTWEEIPLDSCYVPQFYHAEYCHPGKKLFVSSSRVLYTLNKAHYEWATDDQAVNAKNYKTVETLTQTEPHRTARSTLFGIWCARIRRASHTEMWSKETKEIGNDFNKYRGPLSTERHRTSLALVAKSVPANSPVNPMHQKVLQSDTWQRTSIGFKEGTALLTTSRGEATKVRTTQRSSCYRQLTLH